MNYLVINEGIVVQIIPAQAEGSPYQDQVTVPTFDTVAFESERVFNVGDAFFLPQPDPKEVAIAEAYRIMDSEVRAEMVNVFGTSVAESATANQLTWANMLVKPELYSSAGLKDDLGNILNTNELVIAYAQAKINASDAYSVWRLQRVDAFRAERQAILDS